METVKGVNTNGTGCECTAHDFHDLIAWLDDINDSMGFINALCEMAGLEVYNGSQAFAFRNAVMGALKHPMSLCKDSIREITEVFPDDEEIQKYALEEA